MTGTDKSFERIFISAKKGADSECAGAKVTAPAGRPSYTTISSKHLGITPHKIINRSLFYRSIKGNHVKKKSAYISIFPNGLDPLPPPVFLERFEDFFKN